MALTDEVVFDGNTGEGFTNWQPMQDWTKSRLREMGAQQVPV